MGGGGGKKHVFLSCDTPYTVVWCRAAVVRTRGEDDSRPLWLPREAVQASREMLMYVACLMEGVWSPRCVPGLVELFSASSWKEEAIISARGCF